MLGLIFVAPFLLILVIFTLSNTALVQIGFWPTDLQLEAPLSVAVLVASAVFFILGAIVAWLGSLGRRSRARRAEKRVRELEDTVAMLRREASAQRPAMMAAGTGLRTIDG